MASWQDAAWPHQDLALNAGRGGSGAGVPSVPPQCRLGSRTFQRGGVLGGLAPPQPGSLSILVFFFRSGVLFLSHFFLFGFFVFWVCSCGTWD